jgi:CheY-like chemotaxis protein
VEHDQKLLLGEVVVVGIGGLARRDLEQAQPEPLASRLPSEPGAEAAKPRLLARLVELWAAEVGHRTKPTFGGRRTTGEQALAACGRFAPHVVLMDIRMPGSRRARGGALRTAGHGSSC